MTEPDLAAEPPKPPRTGLRLTLVAAFVLLTLGAWLFLEARGVAVPPMSRYWPIFLAVGGLASLVDFLALSRNPASAGQAVFGVGMSIALFAFTLGWVGWRGLLDWLPSLPTILGASLLTTWAANRLRGGLVVPGALLLAFGVLGFALRFESFREMIPSGQILWALLLFGLGAFLLWRIFGARRGSED